MTLVEPTEANFNEFLEHAMKHQAKKPRERFFHVGVVVDLSGLAPQDAWSWGTSIPSGWTLTWYLASWGLGLWCWYQPARYEHWKEEWQKGPGNVFYSKASLWLSLVFGPLRVEWRREFPKPRVVL